MAKGNETTTKFKADISELKAAMQEAKRSVRLANSEFKASTAGLGKWSESADGLSAKMRQLGKTLGAQKTQLSVLEQEYAKVVEEQGKNSKGAEELMIKINNQKAAIGKTKSDLEHYGRALGAVNEASKTAADGTKEIVSETDKLKNSINQQEMELNQLKSAYIESSLAKGKDAEETKNLASDIQKLSGELAQSKGELSQAENAADQLSGGLDDVGDSADKSEGGFTVMKGALADLVADGIQWCIDKVKELALDGGDAMSKFQASTGASTGQMSKFKKEILDIYKQNFGDSISDVADAMAEVKKQTNEVDPSKLKDMTKNAITLRDTFGMDIQESMRAVNMLTKQFGITGDQAFNLIVQGAQKGLDKNGDMLDSINEYAVHYKQMGVTAEGFFNSLANGTKAGTFSVDKLGDAYKEFGIRVKDTATTTTEAYQILGLDADKMRAQFAKGGESAANATKVVLAKLMTMDDKVKQNQAGVDLFGTMWEDLGIKGVKALTNVTGNADKTKKSMAEINKQRYDNAISQLQGIGRAFEVDVLQPVVSRVVPALVQFGSWFSSNAPVIISALVGIGAGFAVFNIATNITALGVAFSQLVLTLKGLAIVLATTPIGWITMLAGAAAGVIAYSVATNKSTDSIDKNSRATNSLISEQKELNKALKDGKKSREEGITAAQAEGKQADFYMQKLTALIGVEKKSASQKAQIKAYVEKLNQIMPGLNLKYDAEKDKLNKSTEAIKANIKAQKDLILAKAAQKNMEGIAANIADLEIKQGEIIKQNTKNEQAYTEAKKKTKEALEAYKDTNMNTYSQEYQNYMSALKNETNKKQAFDKTSGAVEKNKAKLKELNDEYNRTDQYAQGKLDSAEIEKQISEITEKMRAKGIEIPKAVANGMESGKYAIPKTVSGMKNLIKFDEAAKKAGVDGIKIPQELAKGISTGKISAQQAVKQLEAVSSFNGSAAVTAAKAAGIKIPQSLSDGIANGKISVEEATNRVNDAVKFQKAAENAGVDGLKIPKKLAEGVLNGQISLKDAMNQLTNMANTEAGKANPKYKQTGAKGGKAYSDGVASKKGDANKSGQTVGKSADNGMKEGSKGAKSSGGNAGSNYSSGVGSKKQHAKSAGSSLGSASVSGADSGSKGMKGKGEGAGKDFGSGVKSKNEDAKTKGKKLAENAKSGAGSVKTNQSGVNFALGFIKGIGSMLKNAWDAGWNFVKHALSGAKKAGQEHPPSKLTRKSGVNFGMGYILGIESLYNNVENAGAKVFNRAYESMKNSKSVNMAKEKGASVSKNFADGIRSNAKAVTAEAEKMVNDTISQTKKMDGFKMNLSGMKNNLVSGMEKVKSKVSGNIPQISDQTGGKTTNITQNFYQTNNSPKALSRLDIYRQTRNQLDFAKGV